MNTPFDVLGVLGAASGEKIVACLYLPPGLTIAAGSTIAGGTVTGTHALNAGDSIIFAGLSESPAGSAQYTLRSTVSGTALPDCVNAPYTIEARLVDAGTDVTSYTAIAAAFAASSTVRLTLGPGMYAGGFMFAGKWSMPANAGGLTPDQQAQLTRIEQRANQIGSANIQYTGPVSVDGSALVYQGDDYQGARALTWTKKNYAGPSLAGASLLSRWMTRAAYQKSVDAHAAFTAAGTISQVTELDNSLSVTFAIALTAAQTAGLESAPLDDDYNWVVQLVTTTADTLTQTDFLNAVTVRRRVSP